MRTIFIAFFILFSGLVFSQKTTISGTISGFKNGTEVWLGDAELGNTIQKSKIKNNKFIFKNPSSYFPKRLYIKVKEDSTYYSSSAFFVDNQNIILSGDRNDSSRKLIVKGSKSQDESELFEKSYQKLQRKSDSIYDLATEKKKDTIKYKKENIDIDRSNYKKNQQQLELHKIAYIKQYPNSYRSIIELFWLKEKIGKEGVRKIYDQLPDNLKVTDYGKNLKVYLDLEKALQEGDYYQDFQAKDVNNVSHNLSDYIGKKYILLDFIQTYCPGCVMSLEDLKKINEKYKMEVQIITFCGDKSEKTWKEGLKKHKTNWLSLWNDEGLFGKFSQTYGTDGTPTFILINPEGKIIKKQYGYEEGLLDKILEETIAKK